MPCGPRRTRRLTSDTKLRCESKTRRKTLGDSSTHRHSVLRNKCLDRRDRVGGYADDRDTRVLEVNVLCKRIGHEISVSVIDVMAQRNAPTSASRNAHTSLVQP